MKLLILFTILFASFAYWYHFYNTGKLTQEECDNFIKMRKKDDPFTE